jgi:hypothetical protein
MKIKTVDIRNFRGINKTDPPLTLSDINFFIGDNGTGKTSILEAINFCLSSGYVASRLSINDFYGGGEEPIEISVEFEESFMANLPDGYGTQQIACNKVVLTAKKRDRAAPGKAFSDLVTTSHHPLPVAARSEKGWSIARKTGTAFRFDERQLSMSGVVDLPRTFYFSKSRVRQLSKGFNSSFSSIIDDLNWRFDRGQRKSPTEAHFKHHRAELHEKVFSETDGDTLRKTIIAANEILEELGIAPVELSLLRTLTPYDNSEIVFPFDGFELPIQFSGSGIEMLTSIALLEAMAMLTKERIIILIDEPELHLHPKLQAKLLQHLDRISGTVQVVTSTHSPLLFKNAFSNANTKLQVTKKKDGVVSVEDAHSLDFGHLGWSPSWGEICYLAYDLPTTEFHDDLYSSLEDEFRSSPHKKSSQEDFDNWLVFRGVPRDRRWTDSGGRVREETLPTWIRNRIHHPDNRDRPAHTEEQLTQSIEMMRQLMKNSK